MINLQKRGPKRNKLWRQKRLQPIGTSSDQRRLLSKGLLRAALIRRRSRNGISVQDVNSTPHTSLFSRALIMMSHTTLAQVFVRVISSNVSCARVVVCSLFDPHFDLPCVSLYLPLLLREH